MSNPIDSPRYDDDDDGPTIVCLDHVGTNPDTPPPSPMDFWPNGGKPGMGPFGANGMGMPGMPGMMGMGMPMGMGMGMPMMAPNGMPMDPMMAARTMFDAYIKGQQEARGTPVPSSYNHTPREQAEQPNRGYDTLANEMATLKGRIANLQRAQTNHEILSEPRLTPTPDMSQADMLQHHQMEIQRLRQRVANTSDDVYMGPDPLMAIEGAGMGMMGGMVPASVDNVYMQQAKQIETLMQQIEDLETRKLTKKGTDEDPFFANAGREGYRKSHDSEEGLVGDGRSIISVESRAGEGRMADADDFIGDRLMEETSHLEWQPLAPCHYVRMNVKTVDRSNRVLPYEAKMIGRQGTLVIAVTMYNEDWDLLDRTLRGVIRNLTAFREAYGPRMATKITVIVLADGRDKMDESCIEGLRKHGFIDSRLNQPCQPNSIHTFFTRMNLKQGTLDYGPLQVLVAIKESNGGKLHSHKVLLHGFCLRINPTYIFLLDCGTKPKPKALFLLYDYMERDPNIGGCAGEIEADPNWCNPLVMSQVFEYKVAHIFDKAAESLLGFISVLPGAFSAYRYRALTESDGDTGRCPLDKYFDGLSGDYGPFRSNIYLAEDRILGFELIGRHGTSYTLKYIPGSVATTDVPQHVDDLLKQRKRWLNGALFALFYAFLHMKQFFTSGLSVFRKAMISFELVMLTALTVFNLFGLGMYYLIFKFIVYDVLIDDPHEIGFTKNIGKVVANVLNFSFVFVLLIQVVFGLGNSQPTHIKIFYTFATLFFAVFQLIILIMSVWFIAQTTTLNIVYLSVSIGLYFAGAIVHQPKDILLICASGPWYILLTPLYVIVLPMRAFANIHDISWGTKGLEDANVNSRKQGFQRFRSVFILLWLAMNGGLVTLAVVLQGKVDNFSDVALRVSFAIACGINAFRFISLCLVRLEQLCCMGARRPHDDADDPEDDFGVSEVFPGLKEVSPSYPQPGPQPSYPYSSASMTHMPSLPINYSPTALPMSYSPVSGMPNSFVPPTPVGGIGSGGVTSPSSIHMTLDRNMMMPSPPPDSEKGRGRSASVASAGSAANSEIKKTRFAATPSVIPCSNTADYMASVQQYLASMNMEKPQSGEP